MQRLSSFGVVAGGALLSLLAARPALAQMRPGGSTPPPATEQKEGPAESAPENKNELPALQPLPSYPSQKEKSFQFFQLNGYMRARGYLFHDGNMGQWQGATGPKSPFNIPYSEIGSTGQANPPAGQSNPPSSAAARNQKNTRQSLFTSADMRLRIEPTVNVTEQVRVKAQIDIFDNMVLGSSPEGYFLNRGATLQSSSLGVASRGQVTGESGANAVWSSIRAKRAWAEVRTPFGEIRFGRMPSHWGMGMLVNNGDCLDCDFGNNMDRLMFTTKLWGHSFALMWDWAGTGPTTQILGPQAGQGVFYNADKLDDVQQWAIAVGKQDKPEELKEKVDQGKAVFNYGLHLVYRRQDWALSTNPSAATNVDPVTLQAALVSRKANIFVPDLWLRLNWKKLSIEAEGAMVVGVIGSVSDKYPNRRDGLSLVSGGFVVRGGYKLLRDALKIGLEVGYASGDDSEDPDSVINVLQANYTPYRRRYSRFIFDPDYHVDLLLFRRILGAVSNAAYFKGSVQYDIFDSFGARADVLYAIADRAVAYPGNSYHLGVELDISLMYRNEEEGFYAGLSYGVLFPLRGLERHADIFGSQFAKDAGTAQTFQGRIIVKF